MAKRPSWGHVPRLCRYCGSVGPRTMTAFGWAHKYCLEGKQKPDGSMFPRRKK